MKNFAVQSAALVLSIVLTLLIAIAITACILALAGFIL